MNIEYTKSVLTEKHTHEIENNQDRWKSIFVQKFYKKQPKNYMMGTVECPFYCCGFSYLLDNILFGIWTDDIIMPPPMGVITPSIIEATYKNPSVLINMYIPSILWATKIRTPKQTFFSQHTLEFSNRKIQMVAIIEFPKNNQIEKYEAPSSLL